MIQLLPGIRIKVPNRHSTYGRVKLKTIQLFLGKYNEINIIFFSLYCNFTNFICFPSLTHKIYQNVPRPKVPTSHFPDFVLP